MDYWKECIESALEDAGLPYTPTQLESVANDVRIAHEQYGMAYGHDAIPNPVKLENEKLKKELDSERNKRICHVCKGSGEERSYGPVHSSVTQCFKCHGSGFIY
jgi:hypothetical protein